MKTTLDLNDTLLANAKAMAARQRSTLTRVVEEGLRMRLAAPARQPRKRHVLPVFRGGSGMRRGIDPCSNASMLDAMEADDT